MKQIAFEKAGLQHQELIFSWLAEPHMMEFWDNTQEHKDDILNFINGRKQSYFYGTTKYWIGKIDREPFCFILSDEINTTEKDLPNLLRDNLSVTGKTIAIDFGIGNKDYLGKGLAAPTLKSFVSFYQTKIDPSADTFFIDPDEHNPRALHVYKKAGFEVVGDKVLATKGGFVGKKSILMVKKLNQTDVRMVIVTTKDQWEKSKFLRHKYFFGRVPIEDPYTWTFNHPEHLHLLLYQGIDIIGYAHIQFWPENRAAMRIIVIEEPYRNKGYGQKFLRQCEHWLAQRNIKRIVLQSTPQAFPFYSRNGYIKMPFNDPEGYETDPQDIEMGKEL